MKLGMMTVMAFAVGLLGVGCAAGPIDEEETSPPQQEPAIEEDGKIDQTSQELTTCPAPGTCRLASIKCSTLRTGTYCNILQQCFQNHCPFY